MCFNEWNKSFNLTQMWEVKQKKINNGHEQELTNFIKVILQIFFNWLKWNFVLITEEQKKKNFKIFVWIFAWDH